MQSIASQRARDLWVRCLLGVLACLLGCGTPGCGEVYLTSRLDSVSPELLYLAGDLSLSFGGRFESQLELSARTGETTYRTTFQVTLVSDPDTLEPAQTAHRVELSEVVWRSRELLEASIPRDLPPGSYRIEALDPAGRSVDVAESLRVVVPSSQPTQALLSPASSFVVAGEAVRVGVQVVDSVGRAVQVAATVEIRVSPVLSGSLEPDASCLTAVDGHPLISYDEAGQAEKVRGRLDGTGSCSFLLTTQVEGALTASVSTLDLPENLTTSVTLTVLPSTFHHFDVWIGALELEASGGESGEEPLTFEAGERFAIEVRAVDEEGDLVPVTVPIEILDAESGAPAPSLQAESAAPDGTAEDWLTLDEGVWRGTAMYLEVSSTRLLVIGPEQRYGFSEAFEVVAGPPLALWISLDADPAGWVVAGEPFELAITQTDLFGNPVPYRSGQELLVADLTGTLSCGTIEYEEADARVHRCLIRESGSANLIRAVSPDGAAGWIGVSVQAGPPDHLAVVVAGVEDARLVASDEVEVTVEVLDLNHNRVVDAEGLTTLQLVTQSGALWWDEPERPQASLERGRVGFVISLTRAMSEGLNAQATIEEQGLFGTSGFFLVVAGPPARLTLDACPGAADPGCTLASGVPTSGEVFAWDAFDNLTPAVTEPLSFAVTGGTGFDASIPLQVDASAFADRVVLTFGLTTVTTQGVIQVQCSGCAPPVEGSSQSIQVIPGPPSQFSFHEPLPIRFVNEPFILELALRDSNFNVVVGNSGYFQLSGLGLALYDPQDPAPPSPQLPEQTLTLKLSDGRFRGRLMLTRPAEDTALTATLLTDKSIVEPYPLLAILRRDCSSSLIPELQVNGSPDNAVACLSDRPNETDLAASIEIQVRVSSAPESIFWDFGDRTALKSDARATLQKVTHEYTTRGRFPVAAYVQDASGCSTGDVATLFVNADDGSPTGLLILSPGQTALTAGGSAASSTTEVLVQAYDCQGDPATSATRSSLDHVTLSSSLGRVGAGQAGSSTPDQDESIPGNQVLLDKRSGSGYFQIDVSEELSAGVALLRVESDQGVAGGETTLDVLNDSVPPFVIDYHPRGEEAAAGGSVSHVTVAFSEAIRSGVGLENVPVSIYSNLAGALSVSSRSLEPDSSVLILTLGEARVLEVGEIVTVTLNSARGDASFTDVSGNRLDGNWNGALELRDDFQFRFGPGLLMSDDLESGWECSLSTTIFSPDSQDGPVWEADRVDLEVDGTTLIKPRAYRIAVLDWLSGELVSALLGEPTSEGGTMILRQDWDGTDLLGQVLPNGVYELELWLIDLNDYWMPLTCDAPELLLELANPVDLGG